MYNSNYYRPESSGTGSEEKVPIKWMAPESIETNVFDESTDVVSHINSYRSVVCCECTRAHLALHRPRLMHVHTRCTVYPNRNKFLSMTVCTHYSENATQIRLMCSQLYFG